MPDGPSIASDHPWAHIPALVSAGIITKEQARDKIIFAHESTQRVVLRELQALISELLMDDLISQEGVHKINKVIVKAHQEGVPDG